jgi:chloramphenicol 3-O phosphotransferase
VLLQHRARCPAGERAANGAQDDAAAKAQRPYRPPVRRRTLRLVTQRGGSVVFLFGTSSVGKTSTAAALQPLLDEPYLVLGLDMFFGAWPDRWGNGGELARDGFWYERTVDGALVIRCGEHGERLVAGIREAVRGLAASGVNVIYDEMPIHGGVLPAWRDALADLDVHWVRFIGDQSELDAREAARMKARYHGLARGHAPLFDDAAWADLTLDATHLNPQARAARIAEALSR